MAELQKKGQENKKKIELTSNSNGIAGLLALGGALAAAAAFMAAISKQSNRRPNNSPAGEPTKNSPSEEVNCSKKEDQGLLSILETTSLQEENHQRIEEDGFITCSKPIWHHGSIAHESLVSEQKFGSKINGNDEGIICKNGNTPLDGLRTDFSAADDYDIDDAVPTHLHLHTFSDVIHGLIDHQSIKVVGSEKEDYLISSLAETLTAFEESAGVIKELNITDREEGLVEACSSTQSEEEEEEEEEDDDDDDDGDDEDNNDKEEEEEEEESFDGTEDSSMESITEAIWPVNSMMAELTTKEIKSQVESSEKDEMLAKMKETVSTVKISEAQDDKEAAHYRDSGRGRDEKKNAKLETTRNEKNKVCVAMQTKNMNSGLDRKAMWAWALLLFAALLLSHLICAAFSSNVV